MSRNRPYLVDIFERALFGHRPLVLVLFALISVALIWQAIQLRPNASLNKMIPREHPFVQNYLKYEGELRPLGNVLRIAVERTDGDIYGAEYLETLRKVTDEVFYIPGIDRGNLKSLWTPNVNWTEVTEDGFIAGQIIPQGFDGSKEKIDEVRTNVARSGRVGSLVATDQRSAIVLAPLLEIDPETGGKLDYGALSKRLESQVRDAYQSDGIKIHIVGPSKIIGDLIAGAADIVLFFAASFVLSALVLIAYSRCWRSTIATLFCCSMAVVWQLGVVAIMGLGLDPYSILVPFLTFAIGVSHAVQNINTMAAECARGASRMEAAKATFSQLFVPGSVALLCDVVGFSTLLVIKIDVIRELALSASVGVGVIIVTKMFLLPVIMSYIGVSDACVRHRQRTDAEAHPVANGIARFAEPGPAKIALIASLVVLAIGFILSRDLKIGDLGEGAPELRADSRYNRDNAFMASHYSTSSDVFVVIATTKAGECGSYPVASLVDRFQSVMEGVSGVESSSSLFTSMKQVLSGTSSGDLRWYSITRNRYSSNAAHRQLASELFNSDCSMLPILLFLEDHKAETLTRVVAAAEQFAADNPSDAVKLELAAGNAGIEAATNIVIKQQERLMLILVYSIVALLVFIEFRSWRVMICLVFPLYITSVLCEAIMAKLGLGVKVATLPVIALGVGIGVDYGIYIYNRIQQFLDDGFDFKSAYYETLRTTGTAVALTAVMLALGVFTWTFSQIKFQADMGLLLTFMFLWNMVGAVILTPALAVFIVRPRLKFVERRAVQKPASDLKRDESSHAI